MDTEDMEMLNNEEATIEIGAYNSSSVSFFNAFRAMQTNALSTFKSSFADVSK
jgi:hypothetical protein